MTELAERLAAAPRRPNGAVLHRAYPTDRQRTFNEMAAATLGFDFERGRLDATTHPFFAAIGPGDCRITTRYNPNDFGDAFFSTLHEVGHGLYEQGSDPTLAGSAGGRSAVAGRSRVAVASVGKYGRAAASAFWQAFLSRWPGKPFPKR